MALVSVTTLKISLWDITVTIVLIATVIVIATVTALVTATVKESKC
jgi:hypothetical protein